MTEVMVMLGVADVRTEILQSMSVLVSMTVSMSVSVAVAVAVAVVFQPLDG